MSYLWQHYCNRCKPAREGKATARKFERHHKKAGNQEIIHYFLRKCYDFSRFPFFWPIRLAASDFLSDRKIYKIVDRSDMYECMYTRVCVCVCLCVRALVCVWTRASGAGFND